jgi:hypothetical protein
MPVNRLLYRWAPLLLILAMSAVFYYPVLFQHKTQIHAEGVSLGVALMHMLSSALHGNDSMLWTTAIYGGHPVFAEGQGGFANPLHLLFAWLLPAVPAYNIHQWFSMLVSGIGAYGMCRSAHCGRAASTFAALALIFSTLWIGGRSNLAVGSTMSWIPWVLWAMNRWYQRADPPAACFFGATMALMVLSGYPQLVHGVLIYMTVYLAVQLCSRQERDGVRRRLTPLGVTLLLAILLCVGLSAVQWLPLLELAGESHRSAGISIGGLDGAPVVTFLRGFLYTLPDPDGLPDANAGNGLVYFATMGSLLVCMVFSATLLLRRNMLINGHIIATLCLVMLGFGDRGTPLFQLLYDYHLIPGLHSFRVTFVYLYVALVGFALLSALALDTLARFGSTVSIRTPGQPVQSRAHTLVLAAAWACGWAVIVWYLHVEAVPVVQYYLAIAWLACCSLALVAGMHRALPGLAVLLLCIEIIALRMDPFNFGDAGLIEKPQSITSLEQAGDLRDFKFADRNWANTYSLYPPKSSKVRGGLAKMLESVTPAANALWGVSSLTGNTALDLHRRRLADPLIDEELRSGNRQIPGLRLIDFASLKYLSVGGPFAQPGFEVVYRNSDLKVKIVENADVHPRFQFFDDAVFVVGVEEAVAAVADLQRRTLVIESAPDLPVPGAVVAGAGQGEPGFELMIDSSGLYEFELHAPAPAWFFVADANYPGWRAYIDGQETPVYSAQVLGKAIYVPAGKHRLTLVFESASFRWGLAVTLLSLCAMLVLLPQRRGRGPAICPGPTATPSAP